MKHQGALVPVLENETPESVNISFFVGEWVIMGSQKTRGMNSLRKIGYRIVNMKLEAKQLVQLNR